jgi:N-acetyl-anhydromuramyl-L-alanine amidase AmpD
MLTRNYTPASRDESNIYLLILHCTDSEASAQSIHDYFQNTDRQVSAHYIIGRDGDVVQAVRDKDIAWTAGNRDVNKRSINIELCGKCKDFKATLPQQRQLVRLMARLSHEYELSLLKIYTYWEGRVYLSFGVAQHANVQGSDHWDIGPQVPLEEICAHARSTRNAKYGPLKVEKR